VEVKLFLPRPPLEPIPFADLLHRKLFSLFPNFIIRGAGEGKSGVVAVPRPKHIVIPRSAVELNDSELTVRLWVGLPARRRRILGDVARELLLERVPSLVETALREISPAELRERYLLWRDQQFIRGWLKKEGLSFFVADGSVLPRRCGSCEEPLPDAVPFEAPPKYAVELELPSGRVIRGMAGKRLTLVVGPAFHGKTTLLEAIYRGVWNHVPGDGREYVIAQESSFYVESENGRWVSCVDVRAFVKELPRGGDTGCFSTPDASGATSVAASVQEAVEAGSKHILLDEDATATNFIHRDVLAERITGKRTVVPISDLAHSVPFDLTVVASGSLPLAEAAHRIVVMDEYRPREGDSLKEMAREALKALDYKREGEYVLPRSRVIEKSPKVSKWKIRGNLLELRNAGSVDLSPNKQLVECSQTNAAALYAVKLLKPGTGIKSVREVSSRLWNWDYPGVRHPPPNLAYVRPVDIWFILNRVPGVRFRGAAPA